MIRGLFVAVVLVLAGCASGSGSTGAHSRSPSSPSSGIVNAAPVRVPLPAPSTITHLGVVFHVAQVPVDLATATGTTVTAYMFQAAFQRQLACSQPRASARVVAETARVVTVAGFAYRYVGASTTKRCAYTGISVNANSVPFEHRTVLTLHAPLGSRELRDAKSGLPIGVADGRLPPTPSYVPAGYWRGFVQAFTPINHFASEREYLSGPDPLLHPHGKTFVLDVLISSATRMSLTGTPAGTIEGHLAVNKTGNCLMWFDDGRQLVVQVCGLAPTGQQALSQAVLRRVAQSLS